MTSFLHLLRGGLVRFSGQTVHSSHSSFSRRSFFEPSAHTATRMRWSGQIFWLLASGVRLTAHAHLLPAFTADLRRTIGPWEVVSSYSSATAPDSHGISRADPLIQNSQRTVGSNSGLRLRAQELFNQSHRWRVRTPCLRLIHHSTCLSPAAPDSLDRISSSPCRNNFPKPI